MERVYHSCMHARTALTLALALWYWVQPVAAADGLRGKRQKRRVFEDDDVQVLGDQLARSRLRIVRPEKVADLTVWVALP